MTGVFAGALGYLVATWVQSRTTAARAALVFTLEAPFAALFGVLLLSEHLGWAGWTGCAVMLAGHRARRAGGGLCAAAPRPGARVVDAVALALVSAALLRGDAGRRALRARPAARAGGRRRALHAGRDVRACSASRRRCREASRSSACPVPRSPARSPRGSRISSSRSGSARPARRGRRSRSVSAPLFAVTLAVVVFDERPGRGGARRRAPHRGRWRRARARGGAARTRPPSSGSSSALVGAALFALRDNLVRDLSLDTDVPSMTAGAAMLAPGSS